MSGEEIIQEIPVDQGQTAPKPKQYLIMADELHMALFSKMMPGLLFVEVEGMGMQGNDTHKLLVNPLPKSVPVISPIEAAKVEG